MTDHNQKEKYQKITAIITDLDKTLWQGTIAEKEQPILNTEYYSFLESAYKKGIQIFAVSKNDKNDAIQAMNKLGINIDLFTNIIANWDSKYLNIEKISSQTKILPETMIFIDDNILELTEVSKKIPLIKSIDFSKWHDIQNIEYIIQKTEEPESELKQRQNRYRTAIISGSSNNQRKFQDDTEFLKSLKRELSIGEIALEDIPRFTKLLVATHRINFNPYKFTNQDETTDYLYDKINNNYKLYGVSIMENNLDLGLSGALVVKIDHKVATLEDGTFSCGVIGRDFEQKAILSLVEILKIEEVKTLEIPVRLTSTNTRVREIFKELEFNSEKLDYEHVKYIVNIQDYNPKNKFEWIKAHFENPKMEYNGIPSIINFFEKSVKPMMNPNSEIINLGAAQGEVLGHLNENIRNNFYKFIAENNIKYTKIDIEPSQKEDSIYGDAEDLKGNIEDKKADMVIALELLEHTEHFWKVISESNRICKTGGYIVLTVPSYNYPKHEYPIDLWRIGPKTLQSFFPKEYFDIKSLELEGNIETPRRAMIIVQKIKEYNKKYSLPDNGNINWNNGLTIFP